MNAVSLRRLAIRHARKMCRCTWLVKPDLIPASAIGARAAGIGWEAVRQLQGARGLIAAVRHQTSGNWRQLPACGLVGIVHLRRRALARQRRQCIRRRAQRLSRVMNVTGYVFGGLERHRLGI